VAINTRHLAAFTGKLSVLEHILSGVFNGTERIKKYDEKKRAKAIYYERM
jgi:hypothetical protein